MKKYVLWTLPFLLGLGIAFCGARLGGDGSSSSGPSAVDPGDSLEDSSPLLGSESSAPPASADADTSVPVLSLDEPVEPATSGESGAESPATDDADPLSPLASTIRPLGSALPEEALQGVGEPIGFQPLSLAIPDLNVSTAPIEPVGIEDNGELEVPGAEAVGWYQFGAGIGGGRGSTVLAGHIAYNGLDGVFRNLDQMEPGQVFTVDHDGASLSYEVTEVVQFTKEGLPISDLFREDGDERLVLITCGGSFNPSIRSYDDNVVVIAVPVAA